MDLTWKVEHNTGFKSIDMQHQKLFEILINARTKLLNQGNLEVVTSKMLDELIYYGREHFAHEESIMREGGYPGLEEHIKIHNDFFVEVGQY